MGECSPSSDKGRCVLRMPPRSLFDSPSPEARLGGVLASAEDVESMRGVRHAGGVEEVAVCSNGSVSTSLGTPLSDGSSSTCTYGTSLDIERLLISLSYVEARRKAEDEPEEEPHAWQEVGSRLAKLFQDVDSEEEW